MQKALEKMMQMKTAGMQEAVDAYIEEAIRITGSKIGYFSILSLDEDQLTMLGWSKTAMKECKATSKPIIYNVVETGLWGDCVRQRRPVITNDYANLDSPTKRGYPKAHVTILHHMNVPVNDGDKIRGILGVGNKAVGYTELDAWNLQRFADKAWVSMKEALIL
jgi:GAF domain-containing protein